MNQIALDTNAYRALVDGNKKAVEVVRSAHLVGLPVIVLGELCYGFENGTQKEVNMTRLSKFLQTKSLQMLHITSETAYIFGEVATQVRRQGISIQQDDIWIAALCKQYNFQLLTADTGFTHVVGLQTISFNSQLSVS